ncbi:hypothetical protein IFM89_028079 [Coptis chinensis]|uniref:Uncharacterized protein n=1 Tax=Coptis chinensis TaxID=261450 RepID=A0A835HHS9_9MAGN|nr:hypothetical protein IFM89_028079 [Coptis chinensis]
MGLTPTGPSTGEPMDMGFGAIETATRVIDLCASGMPELRSLRLEIALLGASAVLGLFAASDLPFDYVKSQIQKMHDQMHLERLFYKCSLDRGP